MVPTPAVVQPAPCAAADLALGFDGRNGAFDGLQRAGALLVVRNRGGGRCRISGLPRITFAGPGGASLPIRFGPPPGMHPGPVVLPVDLAPGASATAELRWMPSDAVPGGRCHGTAEIRVAFGAEVLDAPFAELFCGPAAGATFGQSWLRADPPNQ